MSFLDRLLASTRARVEEARSKVTDDVLEQRAAAVAPARGLTQALRAAPGVAVIAEIKRATPSKGLLRPDVDPRALAAAYRDGGATAISVLTEPDHFNGSNEDLQAAIGAGLPVLRKDFVLDPWQVLEARALGADAVLLIARILGSELRPLFDAVRALGMDALVEVFDEDDVEAARSVGADLVGINHRDLETFEVDHRRTEVLAPRLDPSVTVVSLSGIATHEDVTSLGDQGAKAVLVGETLVKAADPVAKLKELIG